MIHGERLYDQTSQQAVPTSLAWEGGGREEEGRRERVMEGQRDGGREGDGERRREGESNEWQRPVNKDQHKDYLIISLLSATSLSCSAASSLTHAYIVCQ